MKEERRERRLLCFLFHYTHTYVSDRLSNYVRRSTITVGQSAAYVS